MDNHHLKVQLKQLLKQGYSELEISNMTIAPKNLIKQTINEFNAEQKSCHAHLKAQHNQAAFAMRL